MDTLSLIKVWDEWVCLAKLWLISKRRGRKQTNKRKQNLENQPSKTVSPLYGGTRTSHLVLKRFCNQNRLTNLKITNLNKYVTSFENIFNDL